jgi:excisionase family DNA binding protein
MGAIKRYEEQKKDLTNKNDCGTVFYMKEQEELLTIQEVSDYLKVKPLTVYRWIKQKKIPFIHLGSRNFRFKRSAIEKWLESHAGGGK